MQSYTPGVYLHRGVYCTYKRGFRRACATAQSCQNRQCIPNRDVGESFDLELQCIIVHGFLKDDLAPKYDMLKSNELAKMN